MNRTLKRLTVVDSVHYQDHSGENPLVGETTRFEAEIVDDSLPFSGVGSVGEEWAPLPHGRLTSCSMLCIQNKEGKFIQQVPSVDERADAEAKVIELGIRIDGIVETVPVGIIHPSRSIRYCPTDLKSLMIRCRHARAKFAIQVYPQ